MEARDAPLCIQILLVFRWSAKKRGQEMAGDARDCKFPSLTENSDTAGRSCSARQLRQQARVGSSRISIGPQRSCAPDFISHCPTPEEGCIEGCIEGLTNVSNKSLQLTKGVSVWCHKTVGMPNVHALRGLRTVVGIRAQSKGLHCLAMRVTRCQTPQRCRDVPKSAL